MAKTFQMGAKMTLRDNFKSTISKMAQSTMDFKRPVETTNKSVNTFKNSTGRLRDETSKFTASGNKASVAARAWFNSNGKLTSSLSLVSKGAAAAAGAFGLWQAKNWLIDGNADMETYQNTLAVVLKDQKKAVDMLAWASKFAAKTPFEIPQIVEATTRMSAYGINAQKTLGIVGDMASVMGKDLLSAVEAIADASTGELERMKEFGITRKMIEDQAKLLKVQVTNNKGQITDQKAFNAVLFKLMEDRFQGGMEMQSKTFKGMISNAKDFIGGLGRQLGKPIFDQAKEGLGSLLDWLNRLKENGSVDKFIGKVQQVGAIVSRVFVNSFAVARQNVMMVASKMAQFYSDNKPKIDAIGAALQNAFKKLSDIATPIILWLRNVGLPKVVDALMQVGSWILNIANWFINNWKPISPIVYGIVGALVAYKVAMVGIVVAQKAAMIIEALSKAWCVGTAVLAMFQAGASLATVAQWAFNAAMTANPVGVIVAAIGVLIGVIFLLVKNWKTVKAVLIKGAQAIGDFFIGIWNWIVDAALGAWDGIKNGFTSLWNGIMAVVKAPVNFLIGAINLLLRGLNKISIKIPDWVPLVGGKQFGFSIPEIPYLAKGTDNWKGGPAFMNERGGELAMLPGGSKVIPADKTDKILDRPRNSSPVIHIDKIEINQQPGEDSEHLADRVIDRLYEKMRDAAEIANNGEMTALVGT